MPAWLCARGAGFGRGPRTVGRPRPSNAGLEKPGTRPEKLDGQRGVISFMNIPTYAGQGHILAPELDLEGEDGPFSSDGARSYTRRWMPFS